MMKYITYKTRTNNVKAIGMHINLFSFKKFSRKPISINTTVNEISKPNQVFINLFSSFSDFKDKKSYI